MSHVIVVNYFQFNYDFLKLKQVQKSIPLSFLKIIIIFLPNFSCTISVTFILRSKI